MASPLLSLSAFISLLLLFIVNVPNALSSDTDEIANCVSQLLLLTPCAPFVQGSMASPVKSCCDNLIDLYDQQPNCLCLLLNDTSSFPINKTLALQLPSLCDLTMSTSTCPGLTRLPPGSSQSQAIFGSQTNSSIADSPTMAMAPKVDMPNAGAHMKPGEALDLAAAFIVLMLKDFLVWV